MQKRLMIYDVGEKDAELLVKTREQDILFSASPLVKQCAGCFGCWIKTPGKCVIEDRCAVMPGYIAACDEIVIVSPLLYGGYSQKIKAVIDRSIGYMLPYFRIVDGEMHHQMRYGHRFKLRVYFYGECSGGEVEIAKQLVKANAVNFGAESHEVYFFDAVKAVSEALL